VSDTGKVLEIRFHIHGLTKWVQRKMFKLVGLSQKRFDKRVDTS